MQSLLNLEPAPYNGPFAGRAVMLDALAAAAAPYEGLWTPVRFGRAMSFELTGTWSATSVQLYGTNADAPLNTYTVTIGGTITNGDVVTLTFANPLLLGGTTTAVYNVATGNTTTTIAAGLAAAILTNSQLAALGFLASNVANALTIQWPSLGGTPSIQFASPSDPGNASFTALSSSVSGAATETVTLATGTDGQTIGSAITTKGITIITPPIRWLKTRVASLTGTALSGYLAMQG